MVMNLFGGKVPRALSRPNILTCSHRIFCHFSTSLMSRAHLMVRDYRPRQLSQPGNCVLLQVFAFDLNFHSYVKGADAASVCARSQSDEDSTSPSSVSFLTLAPPLTFRSFNKTSVPAALNTNAMNVTELARGSVSGLRLRVIP